MDITSSTEGTGESLVLTVLESDTPHPEGAIADFEELFLKSGMLDDLRDTAKFLFKSGTVDARTVASLVARYRNLREDLSKTLVGEHAQNMLEWSMDLSDDAPLDLVIVASSQMARWMDLLHQTPEFLLSQRVRVANHREVSAKLTEAQASSTSDPVRELAHVRAGAYL